MRCIALQRTLLYTGKLTILTYMQFLGERDKLFILWWKHKREETIRKVQKLLLDKCLDFIANLQNDVILRK